MCVHRFYRAFLKLPFPRFLKNHSTSKDVFRIEQNSSEHVRNSLSCVPGVASGKICRLVPLVSMVPVEKEAVDRYAICKLR